MKKNHPPGYVDSLYLDKANAIMRRVKQRTYELMRAGEGHTVLDLGCGVGLDTLELAEIVGIKGRVFGVDLDPDMVAEANQRVRQAGLEGRAIHQAGDAASLPFPDGQFDACRSERMLMHLEEPTKAVAELKRVLKPGAWLCLTEPDWGSVSIASDHIDIERRLARVRAERFLRNGYAGRQLSHWMAELGFQELAIEIVPLYWSQLSQVDYLTVLDQVEAFALARGMASQAELEEWRSGLRIRDEEGSFFSSLNIISVAGRKPAEPA